MRQINPAQREVILRIFELSASAAPASTRLPNYSTMDRIPPPRGDRKGWAGSCIRAILYRPLYRGTIIWNKTKAIIRHGTKTSIHRPESEWEIIDAPELRIVLAGPLGTCGAATMARRRNQYARTANGRLLSRPVRGRSALAVSPERDRAMCDLRRLARLSAPA